MCSFFSVQSLRKLHIWTLPFGIEPNTRTRTKKDKAKRKYKNIIYFPIQININFILLFLSIFVLVRFFFFDFVVCSGVHFKFEWKTLHFVLFTNIFLYVSNVNLLFFVRSLLSMFVLVYCVNLSRPIGSSFCFSKTLLFLIRRWRNIQ